MDQSWIPFIKEVGLPGFFLVATYAGLWMVAKKVGLWATTRADKVGEFLGPLVVRLVEATENNARQAEATREVLVQLRSKSFETNQLIRNFLLREAQREGRKEDAS